MSERRAGGRTSRAQPSAAGGAGDPPREHGSLATRLAVFAALAAFGAVHWAGLVVDPPLARTALAVLAVTAGAAALAVVGRSSLSATRAWLLGAAVALAATIGALVAMGLPLRLVWIGNWSELWTNVDLGLADLGDDLEYPYAGENQWARLSILLGGALLLGLGAAAAFWPRRPFQIQSILGVRRISAMPAQTLGLLGLAVLVLLYAVPATENPSSAPLIGGLALFALVAAWLWLPGLRNREAGTAIALVAIAAAVALPLSTQLEDAEGFIDYRNWAWSADDEGTTFSWDHSYGPIDWPRDDRIVLRVESEEPHYWKLATLDHFDGRRWLADPSPQEALELPGQVERTTDFPLTQPPPEEWIAPIRVEVGDLSSNLVPGAGLIRAHRGLSGKAPSQGNGGPIELRRPLEKGDAYEAEVYAPEPEPEQLRASEGRYPPALERSTRIGVVGQEAAADSAECQVPLGCVQLPAIEDDADSELRVVEQIPMPLWGSRGFAARAAQAEARLAASAYAPMLELAREVTAGEETAYDAAKAIETHLRENYSYSELPPDRTFPLSDFLFEDGIGYCQQFSGAMALMGRMVGLPTRIVTGFAPGQREDGATVSTVRNRDAHSWVEVFFNGIGWVTFDPTPAASPASNQSSDNIPAEEELSEQSSGGLGDDPGAPEGGAGGTVADAGAGGFSLWLAAPIALIVLAVGGIAWVAAAASRRRGIPPSARALAQLRELETALPRLGVDLPASATLLGLERALHRAAGTTGVRYLARIRARRFAPGSQPSPSAEDRRALRRGLTSGRGLRGWIRGLLALPPWGPRG
ncbi:MAG: transglutaminase domain-containing protein [Solirubrobacterales bacterium]